MGTAEATVQHDFHIFPACPESTPPAMVSAFKDLQQRLETATKELEKQKKKNEDLTQRISKQQLETLNMKTKQQLQPNLNDAIRAVTPFLPPIERDYVITMMRDFAQAKNRIDSALNFENSEDIDGDLTTQQVVENVTYKVASPPSLGAANGLAIPQSQPYVEFVQVKEEPNEESILVDDDTTDENKDPHDVTMVL